MSTYSELIIGITAPVGVNCSETIEILEREISYHKWLPHLINTSSIILNEDRFSNNKEQEKGLTSFRILEKQRKYTNELDNEIKLNSLNAAIVISHIIKNRKSQIERCEEENRHGVVYIVNALQDDKDSEQLREFYGQAFYQIGITDTEENRRKNIDSILRAEDYNSKKEKNFANDAAQKINKSEIEKVFVNSDFFIKSSENKKNTIERMVDLIFGAPNITPTHSEYSMFMAFMASVNSADLSRQVGAVISSKHLDIIATGSNDVQKSGGGKYWPDSIYKPLTEDSFGTFEDKRDATIGYDANAAEISYLADEIALNLINSPLDISNINKDELASVLRNQTNLKDITEFGRVVHAELSAIMSASRNSLSVVGAHLFCTTFPCHNCAKHIIASGIKKVTFIEPYPKSKALKLHTDAISIDEENDKKVVFTAFTGVGPKRFLDLFSTMALGASSRVIRKNKDGKALPTQKGTYCKPKIPVSLDIQEFNEKRLDIQRAVSLAEDIINRPEELFEKIYTSYIKVFSGSSGVNVIERVKDLSNSYPLDYMFNLSIVKEEYRESLYKGLFVTFKLAVGDTRILLANSIEPLPVEENCSETVIGKFIGTAYKSNRSSDWYINRVSSRHKSDYLIKDTEIIQKLNIDDIAEIEVIFVLTVSTNGYYEAKNVQWQK
ncbi:deaminase [Alteromonas confluentis]|uniref:CMP/dCMP-type deaminase domain-containing protein n=1 Tax=Alteromonas confluentis TaxID=1656094 RepID=A0A1E7ZCB4_9ALTE|nr:deaminase [Alteromonas confluentis]OFC71165.1 hypothetical protein BFC18_08335 [Alteromonas confluentis]